MAAFGVMRLIASLPFEVSPVDSPTSAMVSLTLIAATMLASYVPARRARSAAPIEALRSE
jgi:ABC-type lipoprotein release transport system permease subunit